MLKKIIIYKSDDIYSIIAYTKHGQLQCFLQENIAGICLESIYKTRITYINYSSHIGFIDIGANIGFINLKPNQALQQGSYISAQVINLGNNSKKIKLDTNISHIGRYVIIGTNNKHRFYCEQEKSKQLESIADKYQHMGIIFRTNINDCNDIALVDKEIELLAEQKKLIDRLTKQKSEITCLYSGVALYERLLRDAKLDVNIEVITNDEVVFNNLNKYIDLWQINRLDLDYQLQIDIKQIKQETQQTIITRQGYSLEIHALSGINLIDINSHAAKLNFFQVNYFAIDEIIWQIQLRDLTGIIIIDLIKNMSTAEKIQIKDKVSNLLNKDWRHNKVLGFTNAELFEIIRTK